MIIEFLYQRNKLLILSVPLPLYILQGITFLVTIFISEKAADEYRNSQTLENEFIG